MSGIHEYFKKNPTNWNFIDFLNECDTEPFDAKVDKYTKGLEKIANNQQGERTERAQLLLICFKKGPDRKKANDWEKKRSQRQINIHQSIKGNLNGDRPEDEYKNQTKRKKTDLITDSKIDKIFSPVHVEGNNDHDDEEIILEPQSHKDDIPEEELEDNLLQENSGAPVDFKLIINNICIRSTMERWRKSTKYIDEIHKQDLMRYNIIDTNSSSGTKARELFKYQWDNIISTIEKFLMSEPNKIMLASDSDSISLADQDGRAEDVRQYLTKISKNVNTVKGLCDAIKTECEKLRKEGNIRWKKLSLELMKYTGNSSQIVEISSKEEQTEYDYIIRYVSRVYIMLIKDKPLLKCYWGEKTLRCSAILLNRSLKDDNRRCSGNKIDAIMSILDIGLEFSTLEVSGSPSKPDHIHYVGDRNKTAKMLKIILNYVYIKYSGDFEKFRRIKCTVYKYMITTYMYIVCAAICWNLLFQTRDDVLLSNNCILTFQRVANFCFKLMDVAGLDYFKF
ncbi:unnamed protein product [Rhizophagus irregularis]|nr:unnamed protein product [Rhizophagus irregularis]CAB5185917.1 unnamed protein product [Rhizophagus irregularis]